MHASCESPWHSLAKHHLLGACFPRMVPFRSMLLTLRGGPQCLAPRAHRVPVYPMVFSTFLYRAFTAHIAIAIAGILLTGLARGLCLQHPVVREGMTGDHQPLLRPGAFALQARRHPACDQLDLHRPFLRLCRKVAFEAICAMVSPGDLRCTERESNDGDQLQGGSFPARYHGTVASARPASVQIVVHPARCNAARCRAVFWSSVLTRAEPSGMPPLCDRLLRQASP